MERERGDKEKAGKKMKTPYVSLIIIRIGRIEKISWKCSLKKESEGSVGRGMNMH